MKGKIGDRQRLLHILEAIDEIQFYTANTDLEIFLANSMMRLPVLNKLK